MTFQMLPFWEIFSDSIQILLCAVIIIFLIHNKMKYRQLVLKSSSAKAGAAFSDEILRQQIRQQTEQTFDAIIDYISKQRLALEGICHDEEKAASQSPISINSSGSETAEDGLVEYGDLNSNDSVYKEIIDLGNSGLDYQEISKQVNVPRGEVKLILRLNGLSQTAGERQIQEVRG
jgi:hypothetical protein